MLALTIAAVGQTFVTSTLITVILRRIEKSKQRVLTIYSILSKQEIETNIIRNVKFFFWKLRQSGENQGEQLYYQPSSRQFSKTLATRTQKSKRNFEEDDAAFDLRGPPPLRPKLGQEEEEEEQK